MWTLYLNHFRANSSAREYQVTCHNQGVAESVLAHCRELIDTFAPHVVFESVPRINWPLSFKRLGLNCADYKDHTIRAHQQRGRTTGGTVHTFVARARGGLAFPRDIEFVEEAGPEVSTRPDGVLFSLQSVQVLHAERFFSLRGSKVHHRMPPGELAYIRKPQELVRLAHSVVDAEDARLLKEQADRHWVKGASFFEFSYLADAR